MAPQRAASIGFRETLSFVHARHKKFTYKSQVSHLTAPFQARATAPSLAVLQAPLFSKQIPAPDAIRPCATTDNHSPNHEASHHPHCSSSLSPSLSLQSSSNVTAEPLNRPPWPSPSPSLESPSSGCGVGAAEPSSGDAACFARPDESDGPPLRKCRLASTVDACPPSPSELPSPSAEAGSFLLGTAVSPTKWASSAHESSQRKSVQSEAHHLLWGVLRSSPFSRGRSGSGTSFSTGGRIRVRIQCPKSIVFHSRSDWGFQDEKSRILSGQATTCRPCWCSSGAS